MNPTIQTSDSSSEESSDEETQIDYSNFQRLVTRLTREEVLILLLYTKYLQTNFGQIYQHFKSIKKVEMDDEESSSSGEEFETDFPINQVGYFFDKLCSYLDVVVLQTMFFMLMQL